MKKESVYLPPPPPRRIRKGGGAIAYTCNRHRKKGGRRRVCNFVLLQADRNCARVMCSDNRITKNMYRFIVQYAVVHISNKALLRAYSTYSKI